MKAGRAGRPGSGSGAAEPSPASAADVRVAGTYRNATTRFTSGWSRAAPSGSCGPSRRRSRSGSPTDSGRTRALIAADASNACARTSGGVSCDEYASSYELADSDLLVRDIGGEDHDLHRCLAQSLAQFQWIEQALSDGRRSAYRAGRSTGAARGSAAKEVSRAEARARTPRARPAGRAPPSSRSVPRGRAVDSPDPGPQGTDAETLEEAELEQHAVHPPPESTIATSRSLISPSCSYQWADTTPIRLTFRGGRTRNEAPVAGRRRRAARGGGARPTRSRTTIPAGSASGPTHFRVRQAVARSSRSS